MEEAPTRASRGALIALVALVVLSPWPFGSAHPLVAQAIAVVTLLTSLAALAFLPRRVELPPRVVPPLLGLWLLGALQLVLLPRPLHRLLAPGSAAVWHPSDPVAAAVLGGGLHPISVDPGATARWLAFSTGLVALALLAAPALRQRRAALRASIAVVAGAVAVAIYGLVARLAFGDKLYGFLAVPTIAPFGPFVSKNHFAGYVEIAACLAVGLAVGLADEARRGPERLSWLESPRSGRVVFAWGAAAVLVLAIPVSLSRGGVVSLAAGLVAFAAVRVWMRRSGQASGRMLAFAIVALAVVAIAVALVLPSEATARVRTLGRIGADSSGSYRIAIGRDALRLAMTSPLVGTGFGAFEDAIPRFKTVAGDLRIEHAENDYFELLAEGGLAAGLLAGFLALAAITGALGRIRDEPHRLSRGIRSGALAGVMALLVHGAFDFNLRLPSNALLFVLLAAFALAPAGHAASETAPEQGARRGHTRLLGAAVLAVSTVLAFATPWTGRRFESAQFLRTAGGDTVGLRWRSLERDTIAHLRRRPADATAWVGLGWLRRPGSQAEAAALASWAVGLDPRYEALRRAADDIAGRPTQIQPRRP
jgi:O-antigen ligase